MTGGRVVYNAKRTLGLLGVLALTISACCNSGASTAPSSPASVAPSTPASVAPSPSEAAEPVTIDWWHITTGDPGKTDFQAIADAYTAANPNVKIKITVLENEAFKTKLAATPADAYPDLFQSWGGGTMATQADAGLLQDITAAVAPWKDTVNAGAMSIYQYKGVQYGIPWDMGMIGFWYNKDLFQKAGITAPPATWDEYLAAVPKLKAAGVAPLAIAGKDKWPSMHLWTYLVLRSGGGDALSQMIQTGDWNTDACINAGKAVEALNALDPYQKGYASADYNSEAASVGNGKAAMELMGQWAPSVQKDQSIGQGRSWRQARLVRVPDPDRWGWRCDRRCRRRQRHRRGKNAPPEAIDFLKFFMSVENQNKLNTDGVGLSTTVRHGEHRHRPEPAGRPRRSRRGDVHAALPRPGDQRAPGRGLQRRDRSRCSSASPPPRRSARPSLTRLPRSRRLPASGSLVDSVPRAGRLSRPAHSVGGKQGRVACRTPGCPFGSPAARQVADDRPLPAASPGALPRLRHHPDPPGSALQPVQVERPWCARGLHRAQELPGRPGERRVLAGGGQQPVGHRPVAPPPDPVLARARDPSQPALPRTRHLPAAVLRPLRPVRGDHGHRVQPAPPARCPRRFGPARRRGSRG